MKKYLNETHPELVKEWHPTLNGDLKAEDFTSSNKEKIWWKCLDHTSCNEHIWQAGIGSRTYKNTKCPFCCECPRKVCLCNNLQKNRSDIMKEWHPHKNTIDASKISERSGKIVWWKCSKAICDHHEWQCSVNNRAGVNDRGCPFCSTSPRQFCDCMVLTTTHKDLLSEWDYERNKNGPEMYTIGSNELIHWVCKNENACEFGCHKWQSKIYNRTIGGKGCPYCKIGKICEHKNLFTMFPQICKEWSSKNEKESSKYPYGTTQKVLWKCAKCENEWVATINSRTIGSNNCPKYSCSKGEKAIAEWLTNNSIKYETEKTFVGCVFKHKLRFDFYVPQWNCLIEFDGIQHFDEKSYYLFNEGFVQRLTKDIIKSIFVYKNNIPILRISYQEITLIIQIMNIMKETKITNKIYWNMMNVELNEKILKVYNVFDKLYK